MKTLNRNVEYLVEVVSVDFHCTLSLTPIFSRVKMPNVSRTHGRDSLTKLSRTKDRYSDHGHVVPSASPLPVYGLATPSSFELPQLCTIRNLIAIKEGLQTLVSQN
jgi:hypothetical protein